MAVDADMADVIAENAQTIMAATVGSGSKILPTTAPTDDLLIEVAIDMTDIDIDALERQPEMAFGNLVKKRAEVKVSTLSPEEERVGEGKRQRAQYMVGARCSGSCIS